MNVIVIGAGLAGLTAAICAAEGGAHVTIVAPQYSERAQSVMAMGGINAALDTKGEADSVEVHFKDTMRSGCYINDEAAVRRLADDAPALVEWLAGSCGVNFTRTESGQIDLRYFGGQKKARTAFAGARTGKQLMTGLIATCRRYESDGSIERLTGSSLLSLIVTDERKCAGVVLCNNVTDEITSIQADAVVLCTGGANGIYGKTTGSVMNDGSATGLALEAGAGLANLEMIQYHPTTVDFGDKRLLITEAARGEGGRLYTMRNGERWYFMEEWYPERGALMPRDVVSRSIYKVCNMMGLGIDGKNQVFLDITMMSDEIIRTRLDEVLDTCTSYINIDPHSEPIPVYPGIHYFMGGISTDMRHRTGIESLYAAGECSCQYHGANRLGGNSTLGAVHGGMMAARTILEEVSEGMSQSAADKALADAAARRAQWNARTDKDLCSVSRAEVLKKTASVMNSAMGIYRDGVRLNAALAELVEIEDKLDGLSLNTSYSDRQRLGAMLLLARASVMSALARKESRGAHQRVDFPETDDSRYRRSTIVTSDGGRNLRVDI